MISPFCLWQTEGCELSVEWVWSSWDLIERAIFIGLALMFGYSVLVFVRFLRRDYLTRRTPHDLVGITSDQRTLVVDLSPGLGVVKGIATAAPLLGLAGTSYGILAALSRGWVGSVHSFLAFMFWRIGVTVVTAALGIIVASAATICQKFVGTRIDSLLATLRSKGKRKEYDLGSFQFAQTLPLKKRVSGLPSYALLAAPTLACVIALYMPFHPYRIPTGLHVALPSVKCDHGPGRPFPNRFVVLRITNDAELFINMEPEDRKDLARHLGEIYRLREDRELFVYAEDDVSFETVADAIDIARNSPAPGPDSLDIKVILAAPNAARDCVPIPVRIIPMKQGLR